ncbi:hypothetical protein B296_00003634 [Ensete ventricosum]|uniref:Dilute domain-containing protein n=1 Tax=Ensete ventricosum TaxID=4639 RepID=A0A427ALW5_ENSVE|nr:hypothetical protein B296_00003634 [Ensete ventricosum]
MIFVWSLCIAYLFYLNYFKGVRASPQSAGLPLFNNRLVGGLSDLRQVEAKYPALLFKQQLTAFLEKIYGMIRDNLKKEISPLLGLCIQVLLAVHFGSSYKNLTTQVLHQKPKKTLKEITHDLCPVGTNPRETVFIYISFSYLY